jgi:GNAT superfamily N-acetyltransferase
VTATIRAAEPGDVARIIELYEWLFEPPGERPAGWGAASTHAALARAISARTSCVLVAERAGEPVGLATAYLDIESVRFGRRCWVEDLVVDPRFRSQGIGGSLLDAVADWARDRATHLELTTALGRTDAQRFYERRNPAEKAYTYLWPL